VTFIGSHGLLRPMSTINQIRRVSVLRQIAFALIVGSTAGLLSGVARAEDPAKTSTITIAMSGGKLTLHPPKEWKEVKKRSGMLAHEFSAPADAKEDDKKARITISLASGSIDANITRWYGQFSQSDGKSTKDKSKVEKFQVSGQTVHWVEIPGDFHDKVGGGPFAPGKVVVRKNYRMFAAIVVTEGGGKKCFIKATGPDAVSKKLSEGFKKMLKELEFTK